MKIALFFGSFNPIHMGHLSIAQYVLNETETDEVHFILSPQNPFKQQNELWLTELRWKLLELSIQDNPKFKASDIEFNLPLPSYTSQTLEHLEAQKNGHAYSIIMGADTFNSLPQWKNPEHILSYPLLVYPRLNHEISNSVKAPKIRILHSPIIEYSATQIRTLLKEGKSVRYMVKDEVFEVLKTII
jgi:nicotinate-nucleotide adenylyltransferase